MKSLFSIIKCTLNITHDKFNMIYLETNVWFLIKEPLIKSASERLLTITTLNLRDILNYACNYGKPKTG